MLHPRTAMFVLEMGSMEASHAEVCFVNFESIPPFRKIWNEINTSDINK